MVVYHWMPSFPEVEPKPSALDSFFRYRNFQMVARDGLSSILFGGFQETLIKVHTAYRYRTPWMRSNATKEDSLPLSGTSVPCPWRN